MLEFLDAGPVRLPDAGDADAALPDAGTTDAGDVDSGVADGGSDDAGRPILPTPPLVIAPNDPPPDPFGCALPEVVSATWEDASLLEGGATLPFPIGFGHPDALFAGGVGAGYALSRENGLVRLTP